MPHQMMFQTASQAGHLYARLVLLLFPLIEPKGSTRCLLDYDLKFEFHFFDHPPAFRLLSRANPYSLPISLTTLGSI